MKFPGQTKDGVIDNLLRAYVSRPSNPHQGCTDFDPDRANSYIERSLVGVSRSRYEEHLSVCAACRKNVAALMRLADADRVASGSPAREISKPTWLEGGRRIFGAMSQPRWAMAATAVIVLAVSLPLLLSSDRDGIREQAAEAISADRATPASQASPAEMQKSELSQTKSLTEAQPVARLKPAEANDAASGPATSNYRDGSATKHEPPAKDAPVTSNAESVAVVAAGAEVLKKSEVGGATADEQRKQEGRLSQSPPPQGGAAAGSQVAKSDSEQTRQQQTEKDQAQPAADAKAVRAEDKEKVDRVEEPKPPPASASSSDVAKARRMKQAPGKLSLTETGAAGETVRPEEKRVNGKKFFFKEGAWTDKDFDPAKDLPIVTIIRDSNVYKEVHAKRSGLRPFLTSFPSSERAIIVYRGTVYKLIPQ